MTASESDCAVEWEAISIVLLEGLRFPAGIDSVPTAVQRVGITERAIPAGRAATTLAAKCAVGTALGRPLGARFFGCGHVYRDINGVPRLSYPGHIREQVKPRSHLSLSQDGPYSIAVAVVPDESCTSRPPHARSSDDELRSTLHEMLVEALAAGSARRVVANKGSRSLCGAGVDIVALDRMSVLGEDALKSAGLFTAAEWAEVESSDRMFARLALTFAAKEAVFKTLASAWPDHSGPGSLEIRGLHRHGVTSDVVLSGGLEALARARGITEFAVAVVSGQAYGAATALGVG